MWWTRGRGQCGRRETFSTTRHFGGGTFQRHRGLTFCTVFLRRDHVVQHKIVEAGQAYTQLVEKQGRIQHLFGISCTHVLTAMLESADPSTSLTAPLRQWWPGSPRASKGVGRNSDWSRSWRPSRRAVWSRRSTGQVRS